MRRKENTLDWQAADFARRYPGARILPVAGRWPRVDPSAWIAPGAAVVGDVEIGRDSSVWYGCVLRGDVHAIRVGARTNIQDLSVLHVTKDRFACTVGDEVTIGHRAVVHGCRVGDGALVGIGAIVLDGAELGALAWLAAGSLLAPGASVAPRMLALGAPAKAARELRAEELDLVGYLERAARAGAFVEHRRRQAREAERGRRVVAAAGVDDEIDLHERHLVRLHEPHFEAVRELSLLDRRQREPRRRTEGRRPGAIGAFLRGEHRRREQKCGEPRRLHRAASGSTTSSTRRVSGNHSAAAACTSAGVSTV